MFVENKNHERRCEFTEASLIISKSFIILLAELHLLPPPTNILTKLLRWPLKTINVESFGPKKNDDDDDSHYMEFNCLQKGGGGVRRGMVFYTHPIIGRYQCGDVSKVQLINMPII